MAFKDAVRSLALAALTAAAAAHALDIAAARAGVADSFTVAGDHAL